MSHCEANGESLFLVQPNHTIFGEFISIGPSECMSKSNATTPLPQEANIRGFPRKMIKLLS